MDRSGETFQLILDALHQAALDYMPPCPYRDFYVWAISDENHQRDAWLELVGVKTIGQFLLMLGRELDDATFTALCRASLPLSVYMVFEIAADNLAFGLIRSESNAKRDAEREIQRAYGRAAKGRARQVR